jgi:probable selenium-dependent hydroxylase accessory protein YqeC
MMAMPNYHALRSAQFGPPIGKPLLISLVGGGGKTSTAFWLARQFKSQGHSVFISTTTKMYLPETNQVDKIINLKEIKIQLITQNGIKPPEPGIHFCYKNRIIDENENGKIKVAGVAKETIDELKNKSPFTVFIIESDGAHCLPIKAPDRHEPCIPTTSDMVIGVTGAEVILAQASPERIHRWEKFSALTQCSPGDVIDQRVLVSLIEHQYGMFKHAPEHAIKVWLINKMDLVANQHKMVTLAKQILNETTQPDAVWLAAMNTHTPMIDVLTR